MGLPESPSLRKSVYVLLIAVIAGIIAGRLGSLTRLTEPLMFKGDDDPPDRRGAMTWSGKRPKPTPTLGGNDNSRWATVRALVDDRTFVIGHGDPQRGDPNRKPGTTPLHDTGIAFEPGWSTVDFVLDPKSLNFYSSKPPLLPTLVAGLYWLLKVLFGWTLVNDTFAVVRTILVFVNLIPFLIYLWLLGRLLDRCGASDWARLFVFVAACFATLMTPFLVTLNNHSVAACSVIFAIYPVFSLLKLPLRSHPAGVLPSPAAFALSGLFASFAACNELPAAAFAAALMGVLVLVAARPTLLYFLPAALLPVGAELALNYAAVGELTPVYSKFGTPWYEFEGSNWVKPPPGEIKYGIDFAWMHETRADYAFNVLLGHHGLFSLTPIWLLAVAGLVWGVWHLGRRRAPGVDPPPAPESFDLTVVAGLTFIVSVVVVGFYLFNDRTNQNYGGWTNGLRWLMWLSPLWLLTMLPVVDWLGKRRWGRTLALLLLVWSIFSVNYRDWNPWRQPWLYNLMENNGYIPF